MLNSYQEIFDNQRRCFHDTLKFTPAKERRRKLNMYMEWVYSNKNEIRDAIYEDYKRPGTEVDVTEIKPTIGELKNAISNLDNWMRDEKVPTPLELFGTKSKIVYEPIGQSLILGPWNYPFMLTVGPLVSAIAAGNAVVIKPSELAPKTAKLISRMVMELFDPNEVTVVEGGVDVAQELLKLPFDHIFFTGGTEVGKLIMKSAADHLSKVTLELGGASPAIIDKSANLKDAAEKIVWGKFENVGQRCLAPNHLYLHEEIANDFIAELKKALKKSYGDDFKKTPDLARISTLKHFSHVLNYKETLINEGGEVVVGGDSEEESLYFAPTVIDGLNMNSFCTKEEVFGPVLGIVRYSNLDEVIKKINSLNKPLNIYVFTRRRNVSKKVSASTSSGSLCVNETTLTFIQPYLPFGGVNASGLGKAHGHAGFKAFSHGKAVLKQRIGLTTLKLVSPPYTKRVKWLISFFTRYF